MRRVIAAVLLVLLVSGCASYQVSDLSPEQAVHERSTVRVTLKNGEKVEVGEPWVRGDSLGGNTQNYGATWAVQLNSVATVEVREVAGKTSVTTLGVIGLLGLLAVGVYAILASIAPDLGGWGETGRWY